MASARTMVMFPAFHHSHQNEKDGAENDVEEVV
jgi:hypothetical protein